MFQVIVSGLYNAGQTYNFEYPSLVANMTATTYRPLCKIVSQQTGNQKVYKFSQLFGDDFNERYYMAVTIFKTATSDPSTENLPLGIVLVGTDDFPFGFYDMSIYESTSTSDSSLLIADAIHPPIYKGIMNVTTNKVYKSTYYTEYVANDSDTDSTYITNTLQP